MNYTQKGAIYGLILSGCLWFIPLFNYVVSKISRPVQYILLACWFLLLVVPVWIISRQKKKERIFDERDKRICIGAALAAFVSLFVIGIAAHVLILFWYESFTLSIDHLPILIYGALSVFLLFFSAGVLFWDVCLGKEASPAKPTHRSKMNRIQKMSWLMVITQGVALLSAAVAVAILYYLFGFPVAKAGFAFLGIAGIGGLGPILFRKDPGAVTCDERDRAINSTAAKAGFGASYGIFGLLCMGIWFAKGPDAVIDVGVLPIIWMLAGMTCFFVHALTILILYGRSE
jgi:hypothetical protein